MSKKESAAVVRERLAKKAGYFYRVFSSPDGEKVLEFLEEQFDSNDIHVPGDSHSTEYNLGRRDVVVYIKQMKRYKENAARAELEG